MCNLVIEAFKFHIVASYFSFQEQHNLGCCQSCGSDMLISWF
uniref:Uncharacterized protein n=1 Tax=Arundo donax TaxID=35708 RepID=A0A0A8Y4Z7_ARUDO